MRYNLNGLSVDSEIAICHGRPCAARTPADLVIRHNGIRPVPATLADGKLLQGVASPESLLYTTIRQDDGSALLRIHRRADFEISADHTAVRVWSDPGCDPEMLGIFIAGNLLATVLALRGETVLHASAVEVNGDAVAFVADSGVGKSTLAALSCARGARFVTDDVLRVHDAADGTVSCWPGATENRLRRDVADLSVALSDAATRTSADGRTVWRPPATTFDACRLSAIVLPQPDREHTALQMVRLAPGAAVLELSRRPRLLGWSDERVVSSTFQNLSWLARAVPVFAARVPWGPPFERGVIDALLEQCLGTTSSATQPAR